MKSKFFEKVTNSRHRKVWVSYPSRSKTNKRMDCTHTQALAQNVFAAERQEKQLKPQTG